jgi:hypothetical protein
MKKRSNIYTILVVFLLLIQLLISGCATTVTTDVQKEDLFKEDSQRKDLVEEELDKEEVDLVSQKLYQDKCSLCHELPDINAYSYTSEQWAAVIDNMHDAEEAKGYMTVEETDKIKGYLGNTSQAK